MLILIAAGFVSGMLFPLWICAGLYALYMLNKWIGSVTNNTISTVNTHAVTHNNAFLSILAEKDPAFAKKISEIRGRQAHV